MVNRSRGLGREWAVARGSRPVLAGRRAGAWIHFGEKNSFAAEYLPVV